MAQESPKNSAAEIPVTSNGEVDDSHDHGYHRVRTLYFLLTQRIKTRFCQSPEFVIRNTG